MSRNKKVTLVRSFAEWLSRVTFLLWGRGRLRAGQITCAEQSSADGAFSGRSEHRNLVKFWFADLGLSMSNSILDLICLQDKNLYSRIVPFQGRETHSNKLRS